MSESSNERRDDRPRREGRPSSGRSSSGRPSSSGSGSGRPGSDRPRREGSDRPRREGSDRPRREGSDRPRRDGDARSDRPRRDGDARSDRPRREGDARSDRPRRDSSGRPPRGGAGRDDGRPSMRVEHPRRERIDIEIPEEITGEELDFGVRKELESLAAGNAGEVARHLVAVAMLMDDEPEKAWLHAKAAVNRAGRLAVVREAAGFAAYAAGKYSEALAEFRAARRINGDVSTWPVMADCERGLGRPEKALAMAGAPEVERLDKAGQVELRIVVAGARRDLGQPEAAVVTLSTPDLNNNTAPWSARLRYAYADSLLAAGRVDEARDWFMKCLEVDENEETDAEERLAELPAK